MALGKQDRSVQMKLNMPKNIVLLQTMEEILWTVASVMSSKSILLLWVSKSEPLGHFTGDLFIIFTSVPAQTWSNFSFPFRVIYLILIFTTLFQALLFFLFRLWLRIKMKLMTFIYLCATITLLVPNLVGGQELTERGVSVECMLREPAMRMSCFL